MPTGWQHEELACDPSDPLIWDASCLAIDFVDDKIAMGVEVERWGDVDGCSCGVERAI